jgi:hypothetical protein
MRKITAKKFLAMVSENPSVFENWDTPLEITQYVEGNNSPITHLSKHLIFSGKNPNGDTADFRYCPNLQTATGTFHGFVWFAENGIQKIENLLITQPDNNQIATSFAKCLHLEIATGTYPGFVNFSGCGIHSIQNLNINTPEEEGIYAEFSNCHNLQTLEGWDPSKKICIEPKKLEAEHKRRATLKKFVQESQPQELPFL